VGATTLRGMPRRRTSRARRSLAALVATAALLAGACTNEGDDPTVADGGDETSDEVLVPDADADASVGDARVGPEGFIPPPIEWEDCAYGECATLEVPLDYEDQSLGTTEIFVSREPARGDRRGVLFVNPGGPGGTATDFAATLAVMLPSEVTEHFDIVGVDPRGTGESSPLSCGIPTKELYAADPTIEDDADIDAIIHISEAYVDDCADRHGDVLQHVGTRDVARDMDAVRAAMGEERISYLGFSYGTALGQVYAELFPTRVDKMILDGVLLLGPSGLEQATAQAAGFEVALGRWVEWCAGSTGCAVQADPLGAVETVLALAEEGDGFPSANADRPAGPGEVSLALSMAMYAETLWRPLGTALAEALAGDGSGLVRLADQYIGFGGFEVYFAVNCLDFDWPEDPTEILAAGKGAAEQSPHFGEAIVNDYIRCADWPVEREPIEPVTAEGTPTIVVISTTGDPATPYEAGVELAERLADAVLVTYEGEGHTVVANGVRCIDEIVVRYLVEGEPPADGTTCT